MRDNRCASSLCMSPADFLWSVGSVCNLRRRLFDATLIQREFPPPHTIASLADALRSLELKASVSVVTFNALTRAALPRLIFLRHDDGTCAPALLAKFDGERTLVFLARTNEPVVMTASDVEAEFTGATLEIRDFSAAPSDDVPAP